MTFFLKNTIETMVLQVAQFDRMAEQAAKKDDGEIDKEEKKVLDRIRKLNENYVRELKRLK